MNDSLSKAERTRLFIIEKTAPVFNTKGFAGTSLTDLTDATGLTKGSIYGNFQNKDEVALGCFRFQLQTSNRICKSKNSRYGKFYRAAAGVSKDVPQFFKDSVPENRLSYFEYIDRSR